VPTVVLLRLPDEHGSNSETHQEEASETVQQIQLVLHLVAIAEDDRNCDHTDETVEGMERRKLELVAIDESNTETHLDEDRDLSKTCEEPQGSRSHRFDPMGTQRPHTSQSIGNDHEPGPGDVEIEQHQCSHDSSDASGRVMALYISQR